LKRSKLKIKTCFFILGNAEVSFVDFQRGALRISGANFTGVTDFRTNTSLDDSYMPVWGTCPTAGVDDQNQLDISVYPNPSSDIVYIDGNYTQLKVVVYDILGKQVMKESITNSIDISQLEKGVYILQLSDGAKLTTERILKN
jgi:hypothetical protein